MQRIDGMESRDEALLGDYGRVFLQELKDLGWHVEARSTGAMEVVGVHRKFVNGKPRKQMTARLAYIQRRGPRTIGEGQFHLWTETGLRESFHDAASGFARFLEVVRALGDTDFDLGRTGSDV